MNVETKFDFPETNPHNYLIKNLTSTNPMGKTPCEEKSVVSLEMEKHVHG